MAKPKNQLFCRLDGTTLVVRQEQRATVLHELGLMSSEALPILEETTQKAASFSSAPISILG
ncbi:MAG: histidine kinase, partial [Cyanobacteria bacterium J06623_1]